MSAGMTSTSSSHVSLRTPSKPIVHAFAVGKRARKPGQACRHAERRGQHAVLLTQGSRLSVRATAEQTSASVSDEVVLVPGATGGVGQLVTAKLLERGYKVRAISRSAEKAEQLFGAALPERLEVITGDCREEPFVKSALAGVGLVACCLGTTAFPSLRWRGGGPEATDFFATINLIENTPASLSRFVLVSSVGVERYNKIPFNILNTFGVLEYKKRAEERLQASGVPYTIIRPGRLTDGPYTSYDLNTLLKATSGARQAVVVSPNDDLQDEASRIAVAEAVVQVLKLDSMANKTFSLGSKEGAGPGQDPAAWQRLLSSLG